MRLQQVRVLPGRVLLNNLYRAARTYSEYADKDVLIVYGKSKYGPFFVYEFHAGVENFQHLAGVKSPKGARVFYNKCLRNEIQMEDIIPTNNMKTTSSKIEVLPSTIDLKNSKMYKIGKKNLITEYNQFSMAVGNASSVMGLDKREYFLPVPVTVVNDNIAKYCSAVQNIFLVATKAVENSKYSYILYERTKDILEKADFTEEILGKIQK